MFGKRLSVSTSTVIACVLVHLCFLFLDTSSPPAAEAGVTLKGHTDNGNAYEYVLFGRYPQSFIPSTTQPSAGTAGTDWVEVTSGHNRYTYPAYFSIDPIVWRVLSADRGAGGGKALLFSEKNLDATAFDTRVQNPAGFPEPGNSAGDLWTNRNNNYGYSEIRDFLVGSGGIYGNENYFSAPEKDAVSADRFETANGTGAYPVTTTNPIFLLSEAQLREAAYGFASGTGADTNRIGKNSGYTASRSDMLAANAADYYWMRSPSANYTSYARIVLAGGYLSGYSVYDTAAAVRPAFFLNLESVIFKSGSDLSPSAAEGGRISNPYVLYVASDDVLDTDVSLSVNDNKLTVSFDQPVAHAYIDMADLDALKNKFAVSDDATGITVTSAAVENGKLILTLGEAFAYGEDTSKVTLAYKGLDYGMDTDGVCLLTDRIVMLRLNSGNEIVGATNLTPNPNPNPTPGGGGGDTGTTIPVTGVTLNHDTLDMAAGETGTLSAIVTPSNATNKAVTWKSSDESVAVVDKDGNVTAMGPGTCTITATSGSGKEDVCTVTVTAPAVPSTIAVELDFSGLGLDGGTLKLKPGDAVDLTIAATPAGTTFTATGLPKGLILTPDGRLHGSVPNVGTYTVTVTATAPDGTTRVERFVIEVTDEGVIVTPEGSSGGGCDGGFGALALLVLAAVRKRKLR